MNFFFSDFNFLNIITLYKFSPGRWSIDGYSNSYVSNGLGLGAYRTGGQETQQYGIQYANPTFTEHKIVTPIVKKVPIIVQSYAKGDEEEEHVSS